MEDESRVVDAEYSLRFDLTPAQKEVSDKLCEYIEQKKNVLLEAVCGAGKTELVFEVMAQRLRKGKKVGFTIARRQVVLEIAERLKKAFVNLRVVPVCQGYTRVLNADIIVCTTHQLFRFRDRFDLLIIDEPDAFPFKGNETLKSIALNSCKGNVIYMTATPDRELKNMVYEGQLEHLVLSRRPHGHDLCVPVVFYGNRIEMAFKGIMWLSRQIKAGRKVLLFVSSMARGKKLERLLKPFVKCCYISSKTDGRDEIIADFRKGRYSVCIATLILERGITIENVQVLVWKRESQVFDESSLTQISGRTGRSFAYPEGECLFLCEGRSESVDACIESLRRANGY